MTHHRVQRILLYALMGALLCVFGVGLVYPIWLTVRGGFTENISTGEGFTLDHVRAVFIDPTTRRGLVNAVLLAVSTTALSTVIALPLAVMSSLYVYRFKRLWDALILVPLILPPFVGALGIRAMLGRSGAVNALFGTEFDFLGTARFWGVVVALALHLYPIIYLNLSASLANLDPSLDEAADVAGASPWKRFVRVTLPLIRPGLFAGGAIVLIWSFTELGTPLVFDYFDVTSVQIFNGIKEVETSAQPYALTFVMLTGAVLMYVVGRSSVGREQETASLRAFRGRQTVRLSGAAAIGVNGAFALVTFLALLPHIGVVLISLSRPGSWYNSVLPREWTLANYETALTHPLVFGSISMSVMLSLAAAGMGVVFGLGIAYVIVRTTLRGRSVLDALSMLPLAVPGLVIAFGFIAVSLRWPFGKGDPLSGVINVVGANPNPVPLLIFAYTIRRLPYVVRATVAGLQQVGKELEESAAIFGASPVRAVRSVVVPLILVNLIAGGLLAFSFAMLEVSDSLILAQQERHYPITKAIYTLTERLGDGPAVASAMGVWGMAFLATALVGASVLLGKKLGAIFRV